MPWRSVSVMDQRREFVRLAMLEGANRRELCRNDSGRGCLVGSCPLKPEIFPPGVGDGHRSRRGCATDAPLRVALVNPT